MIIPGILLQWWKSDKKLSNTAIWSTMRFWQVLEIRFARRIAVKGGSSSQHISGALTQQTQRKQTSPTGNWAHLTPSLWLTVNAQYGKLLEDIQQLPPRSSWGFRSDRSNETKSSFTPPWSSLPEKLVREQKQIPRIIFRRLLLKTVTKLKQRPI